MRTSGACIAALLLLAVGISAARQLQQENPVHVIDPWAPGRKCAFLCLLKTGLNIVKGLEGGGTRSGAATVPDTAVLVECHREIEGF